MSVIINFNSFLCRNDIIKYGGVAAFFSRPTDASAFVPLPDFVGVRWFLLDSVEVFNV